MGGRSIESMVAEVKAMSPEQRVLASAAAALDIDRKPVDVGQLAPGNAGKLNIYTCRTCRGHIVTRDLVAGVTPFMIGCKATPDCKGMMESSFYRVWDQKMRASHVWYRPTSTAFLSPSAKAHVDQGGLLLREATDTDEAA